MTIVAIVCSIGIGTGIVGLASAFRDRHASGSSSRTMTNGALAASGTSRMGRLSVGGHSFGWVIKLGLALVTALFVEAFTGWPAGALLGAMATIALPSAIRSTTSQNSTRRIEAVAVWIELLRDTLTTSAGLSQAIVATAAVAPEDIRAPAARLADRTMSGVPLDQALRLFSAEIRDPSADEVVFALRLAATSRAQRLVDLLGVLADSTREEVAMRLRVEASRASARSGVRTVVYFSIGFVALLTVVAHSYLSPFGSMTGQLVLIVVGALYAAGLTLMVRLVRPSSWRRTYAETLRS